MLLGIFIMTDHWNTEKGLLPNVIKHLSASRTRPLALIVNPAGAIEEVSAADLHNAANRAAWFIKQAIPEEEQKFYFMGASDIVYLVWVLGAMKTGKVVSHLRTSSSWSHLFPALSFSKNTSS